MKVLKFGGSSLSSAQGFERCAKIILDEESQSITLVSASGNTTNQLEALLNSNLELAQASIAQIIETHRSIVAELQLSSESLESGFSHYQQRLNDLVTGINLIEVIPDKTQIQLLSVGERLSSLIMHELLAKLLEQAKDKRSSLLVDASMLIKASGDLLNANADILYSRQNLENQPVELANINIAAGFIASSQSGDLMLLGRNGSDYSAASIAAIFDASSCTIWTDVSGIYNADPSLIPNAKVIPNLDYQEAMELAYSGAKVLHSKTIAPLQQYNIPCFVKDSAQPKNKGTVISDSSNSSSLIKGVSFSPEVALINVSGSCLKDMQGSASRIFSSIAKEQISINLITQSSSEYSICFCIDQSKALKAQSALEKEFYYELQAKALNPIEILPDRAIISIIGKGLRHQKGVASRFLHAVSMSSINIEAIAQGSSETSISLVLPQEYARSATVTTHQEFFNRKRRLDLFIIGCGNVGSELINQCIQQNKTLIDKNIELNIKLIANSKNYHYFKDANQLSQWKNHLSDSTNSFSVASLQKIKHQHTLINPTIVDCTCSQQISDLYSDFIKSGFNLVTANKKANSGSYQEYKQLQQLSQNSFRNFRYETNVGAGLPVINTLNHLLNAGDKMQKFSGILSGTLSYILGEVESGKPFSEVVHQAKKLGFTEPDPREDLNGMDVARKLLIISRESGSTLELSDFKIKSLIPESFDDSGSIDQFMSNIQNLDPHFEKLFVEPKKQQATIRYVAEIQNKTLYVGLQRVPQSDPLYSVKGGENAIAIYSHYYSPIPLVLRGYGAGAEVTAAGLFSDILQTLPHREMEAA